MCYSISLLIFEQITDYISGTEMLNQNYHCANARHPSERWTHSKINSSIVSLTPCFSLYFLTLRCGHVIILKFFSNWSRKCCCSNCEYCLWFIGYFGFMYIYLYVSWRMITKEWMTVLIWKFYKPNNSLWSLFNFIWCFFEDFI